MKTKVIVLMEGGGALGAFQCGAWKALAPFLHSANHEVSVIAGASIGAVNAGLIARHYGQPDRGAQFLEEFWRKRLAMPVFPFFPAITEYWGAWNGLLSALLFGNRSLFMPNYPYWNPLAESFRFQQPIYRTQEAVHTLEETFGGYQGAEPLLVVSASNVQTGTTTLFDSRTRTVTPKMIVASMSIPILFPPTEVDGQAYWDGEIRSNTLLPDVLALLRAQQEEKPNSAQRYLVILIGMLKPDTAVLPSSTMESAYRLFNIILGDKLKYDTQAVETANRHLRFVEQAAALAATDPGSPLSRAVLAEHDRLLAEEQAHVEFLHIGREQFRYEHVSRDFSYSPEYIDRLITQGQENASRAIDDYRSRHTTLPQLRQQAA